jgi:hypothetical protein
MKIAKEILTMLVSELISHIDKIRSSSQTLVYYNELLGDTSFLLARFLELLLKKNFNEWDIRKWFDDCLITKVAIQNNTLKIDGVMIWGRNNTTEQWTEPFIFEIELLIENSSLEDFTFFFGDLYYNEITYEEFVNDREYWANKNNNWKYIIKSNEVELESS